MSGGAVHTPGPWEAGNTCSQEFRWIVTAPHPFSETARLRIAGGIEDESHARLIAAAPDLLEALERMVTLFEMDDEASDPSTDVYAAIAYARAATGAAQ